jgi:hypothetical protein
MNSVRLYMKLKDFWAKRSSCGNLTPPPSIKFPGKRWVFEQHGNKYKSWHVVRWMPVLPKEKDERGAFWTRLTYEEFCYALGLEMMP